MSRVDELSQLRQQLRPGVTLECVENTLARGRKGARLTVTELTSDRVRGVADDGATREIILPRQRALIDFRTADVVRWRLDLSGPLAKHLVVYRIEQPVS